MNPSTNTQSIGTVYLIGAGPGDVGLLTNKGLDLLKNCDCLVYDRLIQPDMLSLAPRNCKRIYVGKAASDHAMPQEEINLLLCDLAKEYKTVVRLKGGDPYVFGRGGEEGEVLRAHKVPFEVVPGISSSIGGLAYAGIPITHRNHASSFHVFTGHFKDDSKDHDWSIVSKLEGTLVFLMSISSIPYITAKLVENGRNKEMPVAVVSNAASPSQEVFESTLENAMAELPIGNIKSPALLVVGDVIHMRKTLNWFEEKPLFGKKIIVTRASAQSSRFASMLKAKGAVVEELPMIEINPLGISLDREKLQKGSQIWFTSENGVHQFMNSLFESGLDVRALGHLKVLAIGPTTSKILEGYGIRPDYMPSRFTQEGIIETMQPILTEDDHILIPCAKVTRPLLTDWLEAFCTYEKFAVYETVQASIQDEDLQTVKQKVSEADYITFASASAVDHFTQFVSNNNLTLSRKSKMAAIGPITEDALREHHHPVAISSSPHTLAAMMQAIIEDVQKEAIQCNVSED